MNKVLGSTICCMIMTILDVVSTFDNLSSLQFFNVKKFVMLGLP